MPRPVRTRLTACLVAVAATTALGVALAPAASADPVRGTEVLQHLSGTSSAVPSIWPNVPPFGRRLG